MVNFFINIEAIPNRNRMEKCNPIYKKGLTCIGKRKIVRIRKFSLVSHNCLRISYDKRQSVSNAV